MLNTKLCKVTVYFSSKKNKHDFYRFICLNDSDFFQSYDSIKKHICSQFKLDSFSIRSVDFDYLEVLE